MTRALLLAAGLGTRLRPLTNTVPKCLVPINGRPLLDHWIELLSNAQITEILINLHHMPEMVRKYISSCRYPVNITTVMEDQLLGTGGTLLRNRDFFQGEPLMLIHADNLSLFDPHAFMERFYSRGKEIDITMMTFRTNAPETCGIVEIDERGAVTALYEKTAAPHGNLANAAVYVFAPTVAEFIERINKQTVDISTEVLPWFIGRINTFHNELYHRDIGTIESLEAAQIEYPAAVANQSLLKTLVRPQ